MIVLPSLLDTDFYKLTMQQAVLEHYPNTNVKYKFTNRKAQETNFTQEFADELRASINATSSLRLKKDEKKWLQEKYAFLKPQYIEYLSNYEFDPSEVDFSVNDGKLELNISGPWHRTILWEVPLMAIISELHGQFTADQWNYDGQEAKIVQKGSALAAEGCKFADFGTRRRRSYFTQDLVVKNLMLFNNCVGTSNVHLAQKYNLRAIGTQAHEWVMGVSALESLRHANRFAMQKWCDTYGANLGTVLPDTFGIKAFFDDFTLYYASLFDSIRHDSGDPFKFTDKVIAHYKKLNIDPNSKTIIFSDGLNVELAIELNRYCSGKIKCAFGIGTNFTNDFATKSLNMVIKLYSVDGIPVVKLSDEPTKATGDKKAVEVAKWTFGIEE